VNIDNEIMMKVRHGDVGKLGVLFERHHKRLFNFFLMGTRNRDTSEDLVQDVFLKIMKYRSSFRDSSDFTPWMFAIARNAKIDYYRKRENTLDALDEKGDVPSGDPGPDTSTEHENDVSYLKRALDSMPEEMREVIVLSHYDDMRYKDIATVLGCTEGAVKVRVFRAVKELARKYKTLTGGNGDGL